MNFIKRFINFYRNNGFLGTIKAIFRKIFKKAFKVINKSNKKIKNFELTLNKNEIESVSLKEGIRKKIYIFGTVPYYDVGGGQRSSQLAKVFNKMGFLVKYIYAFDSSESKVFNLEMPVSMHKNIANLKEEYFENDIKKDDIVIFEAPIASFNPYLKIAHNIGAKVVYENIDNWETSLGSMFFDKDTLKDMLAYSDMITATAELLVDQTKEYFAKYNLPKKEVYYLANAVDDELFEPRKEYEKPKDLVLGKKTLVYYGSLWGEWFDWNLIAKVASTLPDITINLIGDYKPVISKKNELPKNVHFLGLKKQCDLPAYLVYSDYAILPFKCSDIGNYVSPLKIFEYISMNKRVLSTALPDINGYPNVFLSNEAEKWCDILNKDINVDIKKRDEFIEANNWHARCSKILDILFEEESKKINNEFYNNISVIVLNYNNKKVIFKNVDTLLKYNNRYNYEIIVVDNNSKDGSYELLKESYKDKIKLIRNTKNGCSSGRNLGVENATKDYILFLDSDEWILNRYWLDSYISILKNDEKIGAVGWSAGWFNKQGFAYKYIAWYEHNFMPPNMLYRKDIGYLATCGFLMKKELFNKIKGFDEFYDPTCYEDTDLSLAVRNAGFETVYSKYLGVGHLPHQTTKSGSEAHSNLMQEKGRYFVNKWKEKNPDLIFKYIKR